MRRRVDWLKLTDASKEHIASIFRIEKKAKKAGSGQLLALKMETV
jgi:hypothetical protein